VTTAAGTPLADVTLAALREGRVNPSELELKEYEVVLAPPWAEGPSG
jgi:hypothetical protein